MAKQPAPRQNSLAFDNPNTGPDMGAEDALIREGLGPVAGVDEVGRGPLAGPVVAAAVVLNPGKIPAGLRDSKKLTDTRRRVLAVEIRAHAVAWALGEATVEEIDRLNILQATFLAMRRAVGALSPPPGACLVDGNRDPLLGMPTRTLIKGDDRSLSIAAASILAKVHRDDLMADLHQAFPAYGWAQNAGYGVKAHREALEAVGPSPHHRKSFAPVRRLISQESDIKS